MALQGSEGNIITGTVGSVLHARLIVKVHIFSAMEVTFE